MKSARLLASDKWILSELSVLIDNCMKGYREYDFFVPATALRDFVWETFASHYVEMVKPRSYGQGFSKAQQRAAWFTLHTVLKNILLLLTPLTPFMTDYVWIQLYSKRSIHIQELPRAVWPKAHKRYTKKMLAFNREVWKIKEERKLTLRDPVEASVPRVLAPFENDLVRMHSLIAKP